MSNHVMKFLSFIWSWGERKNKREKKKKRKKEVMKEKKKNKKNSYRVKYTETCEEGFTFDFIVSVKKCEDSRVSAQLK